MPQNPSRFFSLIRQGYTLVEVMVAFVVFAVAILGAIGLMTFGLKTLDDAKALNQATQILMNEMEAMRMRSWLDQTYIRGSTTAVMHGLKTIGTGIQDNGASTSAKWVPPGGKLISSGRSEAGVSGNYTWAETTSTFTPYAVYGVAPNSTAPNAVATLGGEVPLLGTDGKTASQVQLRAASGYTCTRKVTLTRSTGVTEDVDTSTVTLTISWTDSRGITHTRSHIGTMSKNGLNDYLYRTYPANL